MAKQLQHDALEHTKWKVLMVGVAVVFPVHVLRRLIASYRCCSDTLFLFAVTRARPPPVQFMITNTKRVQAK